MNVSDKTLDRLIGQDICTFYCYGTELHLFFENDTLEIHNYEYFWRLTAGDALIASTGDFVLLAEDAYSVLNTPVLRANHPKDREKISAWVEERDADELFDDLSGELDEHHTAVTAKMMDVMEYKPIKNIFRNALGDVIISIGNDVVLSCYKL